MRESLPGALMSGVGPGTGAAMARRFARGGYAVAMLACWRRSIVNTKIGAS